MAITDYLTDFIDTTDSGSATTNTYDDTALKEQIASLEEQYNALNSKLSSGSADTVSSGSSISASGMGGAVTEGSQQRNELVGEAVSTNLTEPQIPESAQQTYTNLEPGADEFANATDERFQTTGDYTAGAAQAQAQEGVTVDTGAITSATMEAAQAEGAGAQGQAAQGELPPEAMVQNQMSELLAGIENGDIPTWARPAVDQVEAQLAARGLSRSSVGQAALTNAIITAALPMAQQNAQAETQMAQANLSNRQQMAVVNIQNRQQAILSNQAAENAARQFNAASENQTQQFMTNLKATVDMTNAARLDAMAQYNTGQTNAISQFNTQLQFARDQFNAQNATAIEQSNLQWRRQVNQINTAGINSVNQANAMNAFNLSNQALTFMWQELRDQAKWSFEAAQNEAQRKAALAQAALGNEAATDATKMQQIAALGAAAFNVWYENR